MPLPSRFAKKKKKAEFVCVEPVRKSLYDVMLENMSYFNRNVFINRLIYLGSHTFPLAENDNIGTRFRTNIEHVNSTHCEEYLTGYLLHYRRHFIHVLDGCEESMMKHLNLLFLNESTKDYLGTVKVLVCYHNINQRFLRSWIEVTARPPHLVNKINFDLDAAETRNKITNCLKKLYKFGLLLRGNEDDGIECDLEEDNRKFFSSFFDGDEEERNRRVTSFAAPVSVVGISKMDISTINVMSQTTRGMYTIPEQQLTEFLVETPYLMTLQDFMKAYGRLPLLPSFSDKCWPVETDYVPRNIFDTEYDPVVDIAPQHTEDIGAI